MNKSRREFLGKSFAALGAVALAPSLLSSCSGNKDASAAAAADAAAANGNPNSVFNGVAIGTITYSWRSMPGGLENIVKYCHETGISTIELMSNDLESYLGAPESPMMRIMQEARKNQPQQPAGGAPGGAPGPMRRPSFTAEQQAEIDKYNADVKAWRVNIDMDKVAQAKKLLDDNGIEAHIVKFSPSSWSDEEIDYAFIVAKAMGAKAVSEEVGMEMAQKLAPFAEKHDMYVVCHQHMQFADPDFDYDKILAVSPRIMMNFDSGHFFGSTGRNPIEIIEKYHDRIFSIHIKDKTGPNTQPTPNTNQVWGQGEMPLEEVLTYIKDKKYPIYCDIELEYDVKPWSNAVKEVRTCVNYAKRILLLP